MMVTMNENTNWMNPKLELRSSRKHGKGVFAKENIDKDERLAIFGGDVMLIDEIYDLPDDFHEYALQIEERFILGSRNWVEKEDSDCINHSCDPNAGFNGQIFLVAMRNIRKDEEIPFDYALTVSKSMGSNIVFEMECNCGSKNCRKKITEDDWKLPELRKRYNGFFSQYIQEKTDMETRSNSRNNK